MLAVFSTQRTEFVFVQINNICKMNCIWSYRVFEPIFASFKQENLKDFLIKHIYLNLKKMTMLKIAYTGFVVRLLRGRND